MLIWEFIILWSVNLKYILCRWCNPCKLLAPRIEHVIDEKKGKVLLAKVDIDELSDIALDNEVKILI